MRNLILFGPPGAGKGTQSAFLVDHYNLVHLSTGDIFRANIKGETELGKLAQSYMDQGQLVPDDVTIRMLESEVNKHPDAAGFIFDGFPRTTAQASALDAFLEGKGQTISAMLALEVPEDELKTRLLARAATTSTRVERVSPGRTGAVQRTLSMPGPPSPVPSTAPVRMNCPVAIATVWKPLATCSPKAESFQPPKL